MNLKKQEICRRIIRTWMNNIDDRIKLYDKGSNILKMKELYESYYRYLTSGHDGREFNYSGELTEKGWSLFNEIKYFLPSYIGIDELIEDNYGVDCDYNEDDEEPTPF